MREPLIDWRQIEQVAASRGLCVPAFDWGLGRPEFLQAVLATCRRLDSFALFIVWIGAARSYGLRAAVSLVRELAAEAGVPAAICLDHAEREEDLRDAIAAGFGAVMFDCSGATLEENIARTRAVVEEAHAAGAVVEAAFGLLGAEGGGGEQALTEPETAARFVEETGVDLFVPSVGNRHGLRGVTVPLDWDLIRELRARIAIPMVLHGGSGIAIAEARRAGELGFRKLNLFTMLHCDYSDSVKAYLAAHPEARWYQWAEAGREALAQTVERYLVQLEMAGTASLLARG